MTLGDAIRDALKTKDAAKAGSISDRLRFQYGLNYNQSFDVVKRAKPGTELAEWDALLYEADTIADRGPRRPGAGQTIYSW